MTSTLYRKSGIFRIFIFRMYKFLYVRTLLFTNTVYFHIPVNFQIFKFRTLTVIRNFPELRYISPDQMKLVLLH